MTAAMDMPRAGADVPADRQVHLAQAFGRTFQGEGPSRGRLACFVRFAGCNLTCGAHLPAGADGMRCDTGYSWDPGQGMRDWCRPVPVVDVVAFLRAHPAPLWVITGGEPLLHQRSRGMRILLDAAATGGIDVEFETNGTLVPDVTMLGPRPRFNVSPKLTNTGDDVARRIVPAALRAFVELAAEGRAVFKFVSTGPDDLAEVDDLVALFKMPAAAVWVMPEGITPDRIIDVGRALADPVIKRGWNLTLRDHLLLWPTDKSR